MADIFLRIADTAIMAGIAVLAVLLLRLIFGRTSSAVKCAMWAVVALRLILLFPIESRYAILPAISVKEMIGERIEEAGKVGGNDEASVTAENNAAPANAENSVGHSVEDTDIDKGYSESADISAVYPDNIVTGKEEREPGSDNDLPIEMNARGDSFSAAGYIWLAGVIAFLCYAAYSSIRLRSRLKTAVRMDGQQDVYMSENAASPFVFGILHPVIYMGFGVSGTDAGNVIAHERMHIRRKDHLFKLLSFVLLAFYWFVPWVWAAYYLYCRDMELACDEAVIRDLDGEKRAEYSETLLTFALNRHNRIFCPISFGEIGIRARIKNILKYKKRSVWIAGAAIVVCAAAAVVLFLTPDKDGGSPDEDAAIELSGDGLTSAADSSVDTDPIDSRITESYKYSIVPGDDAWKKMTNVIERREACFVPEYILKDMTTEALVKTVVTYPLFIDIYVFNSPDTGFEWIAQYFKGVEILSEREDALDTIKSCMQDLNVDNETEVYYYYNCISVANYIQKRQNPVSTLRFDSP